MMSIKSLERVLILLSLIGISNSIEDSLKDELTLKAENHFNASFPDLSFGNYEGEHWLTSFAILATTSQP